jgi:hypothetical protein
VYARSNFFFQALGIKYSVLELLKFEFYRAIPDNEIKKQKINYLSSFITILFKKQVLDRMVGL